jgi:hypothetical protein
VGTETVVVAWSGFVNVGVPEELELELSSNVDCVRNVNWVGKVYDTLEWVDVVSEDEGDVVVGVVELGLFVVSLVVDDMLDFGVVVERVGDSLGLVAVLGVNVDVVVGRLELDGDMWLDEPELVVVPGVDVGVVLKGGDVWLDEPELVVVPGVDVGVVVGRLNGGDVWLDEPELVVVLGVDVGVVVGRLNGGDMWLDEPELVVTLGVDVGVVVGRLNGGEI